MDREAFPKTNGGASDATVALGRGGSRRLACGAGRSGLDVACRGSSRASVCPLHRPLRGRPTPRDRYCRERGEPRPRSLVGNGVLRRLGPQRGAGRHHPDRERLRGDGAAARLHGSGARSDGRRRRDRGNGRLELGRGNRRAARPPRDPRGGRAGGLRRPAPLPAASHLEHACAARSCAAAGARAARPGSARRTPAGACSTAACDTAAPCTHGGRTAARSRTSTQPASAGPVPAGPARRASDGRGTARPAGRSRPGRAVAGVGGADGPECVRQTRCPLLRTDGARFWRHGRLPQAGGPGSPLTHSAGCARLLELCASSRRGRRLDGGTRQGSHGQLHVTRQHIDRRRSSCRPAECCIDRCGLVAAGSRTIARWACGEPFSHRRPGNLQGCSAGRRGSGFRPRPRGGAGRARSCPHDSARRPPDVCGAAPGASGRRARAAGPLGGRRRRCARGVAGAQGPKEDRSGTCPYHFRR